MHFNDQAERGLHTWFGAWFGFVGCLALISSAAGVALIIAIIMLLWQWFNAGGINGLVR